MADYFPAKIEIGGPIERKSVPGLIEQIQAQSASLDWGSGSFEPESEQDLVDALNDEDFLVLCDDQATFGRFEDLEKFLIDNGISFDLASDGHHECSATLTINRPGFHRVLLTDADGGIVVPAEHVTAIRKAVESGAYEEAINICKTALPDYPGLEPLVFFDEEDGTRDI